MVKLHELPTTRVSMGVKLPPPPPKLITFTNADLFRLDGFGLYAFKGKKNDYVYSNIEYNDQFPETLSRKQINFLTALFETVKEYIDTNPLMNESVHRITKSLRQKTTILGQQCRNYYKELGNLELPPSLNEACITLLDFTLELVESFYFNDALITDIKKIPNRPADGHIRELVHEIILNYQKTKQTNKFPLYPYIVESLKALESDEKELKLSARQYGNYKKWLKRGTYYWYIQP